MSKDKSIFVNQIGYVTHELKNAFVTGADGGEEFFLISDDGSVVYKGKLALPVEDKVSGEKVCLADFSDFNTDGVYFVKVQDYSSVSFRIGLNLYDDLYFSILKYFYLSRCGQEIDGEDWSHSACHTGIAEIYGTNQKKEVLGGWHDAGDYGRYVVAGAKTVMDLLFAYEASKSVFDRFDILSEVRFELEWMLDMQREDGAVYHKISCYHFCPFILPQEEKDKIVISPVSTAATADFAGCLAYASSFYKETDFKFSEKLITAAVKAQVYLDTHEDELYRNPPEITTGGYGDWNVKDERYFALCSLFAVTGNELYLEKAMLIRKEAMSLPYNEAEPWKKPWFDAYGWGCVSGYGNEIILRNADKIKNKNIVDDVKAAVLKEADKLLSIVNQASFSTSLIKVFWGSNGQICDQAHMLVLAYELTGEKQYFDGAVKQLNYVLGCNPLNICYVTGFGTNTVHNPHHRPSGAINRTMPGMLSGGPCEGLIDEEAKKYLQGMPPLKCFIDKIGSYSTNEVAIYWNSALVYLVAKVAL